MMAKGATYKSDLAAPYVNDYVSRRSLAKLGYRESFDELDCITAEAFLVIDETIAEVMSKKK
jgi:hypothetical protein